MEDLYRNALDELRGVIDSRAPDHARSARVAARQFLRLRRSRRASVLPPPDPAAVGSRGTAGLRTLSARNSRGLPGERRPHLDQEIGYLFVPRSPMAAGGTLDEVIVSPIDDVRAASVSARWCSVSRRKTSFPPVRQDGAARARSASGSAAACTGRNSRRDADAALPEELTERRHARAGLGPFYRRRWAARHTWCFTSRWRSARLFRPRSACACIRWWRASAPPTACAGGSSAGARRRWRWVSR